VGKILRKSPSAAGFVNRHFETLSWLFVILTVVSAALSVQAIYNLIMFQNCNGPNSSEFCAITGKGGAANEACPTPDVNEWKKGIEITDLNSVLK
jgi:hypothetical protein